MSLPTAFLQPAGAAPGRPPTYWHGGPKINGDSLLPAVNTGAYGMAHGENAQFVYFTQRVELALFYAVSVEAGWLYEVEPLGAVERDREHLRGDAFRCRQGARILRRIELTPEVRARAFELLPPALRTTLHMAPNLRRLAAIAEVLQSRAEEVRAQRKAYFDAFLRTYTGRGGP